MKSRVPGFHLLLPVALATLLVAGLVRGQEGDFSKGVFRRPPKRVPVDTTSHLKKKLDFLTPIPRTPSQDRGDYHGWGRSTGGAVKLIRAGELRQDQTSRGEIAILREDVKLIQDSLTIWCDEARHLRAKKILEMRGNVVMIDPTRRLDADQVFYYSDERRSMARGHVTMTRDSVVLTCDEGKFDEANHLATFESALKIRDLRRSVVLTGGYGTYETEKQTGRIPMRPVLVRLDSTGSEEARITSKYMEYNADNGYALARDSVHIYWEDVQGRADKMMYYPSDARALLVGSPKVFRERDEATGDSIWLYMTKGKLDSTVIIGHAIAYTPSDSLGNAPRSRLEGEQIVMDFVDGKVDHMQSVGQATGIYHIFEKGEDKGSNKVSGDRVTLKMKDGALSDVIVVGGTEGTFLPPELAGKLRRDE